MATNDSKTEVLKRIKQRYYLNKDFDSFRADLLTYKRTFFPNTPQDDSDASVSGLLMDLPSYIGDVLSFYMDHQFFELDPTTAVEPKNVQKHLERSSVPIIGASSAVVEQTFNFEVPADPTNSQIPDSTAMPKLFAGTTVVSTNGIQFQLVDDLDFTQTNQFGIFYATYAVLRTNPNTGNPTSYLVSRKGICISGQVGSETFNIGSFVPYFQYTINRPNVTEVTRIIDSNGNEYHEVEYLTQDTVYKAMTNLNYDRELVKENFIPVPAPYRFIKKMDVNTKLTTITFGGGSAESNDDDIIPDPSQFAVPLYGKRVVSRFTINPGNMLQTTTLGTVVPNSTLTVTYRYSGGLSHNVPANSIRGISSLNISFPNEPTNSAAQFVRNSASTINDINASGGEDAPSLNDLRLKIPQYTNSQSRIVSKQDLLSRIYTMPTNFGRVYRAAIHSNPHNPLASILYIISRDPNDKLIVSPDTLKKNLAAYVNEYRLTSDALDVLDARVINLKIEFSVVLDPSNNRNAVLGTIVSSLKNYFQNRRFSIDQPLIKSDIINLIYNSVGVISVNEVKVRNLFGSSTDTASGPGDARQYSDAQFDVEGATYKGIIFPPTGGIFEIRYVDFDIVGVIV